MYLKKFFGNVSILVHARCHEKPEGTINQGFPVNALVRIAATTPL